jgi:hypothetical protein
MNEADIGLFQFDFDLTWMAFFLSANEHIYSRYGGRDGGDPEGRLSIDGFKHTMRLVLAEHRKAPREPSPPSPRQPMTPANMFEVKGKGCLHCHQVWEGIRKDAQKKKTLDPNSLYVYPLPENVGLSVDRDAGNCVTKVEPGSPAARAGILRGDTLERIDTTPILSQGDIMCALHHAPWEGRVPVQYQRNGKSQPGTLILDDGWKRTDLAWRPSMRKLKK